MEKALWPDPTQYRRDLLLATEMAQTFGKLLLALLPPYLKRVGVDAQDITRVPDVLPEGD